MAFDMDEMKKRRKQREKELQKRLKQQKQMTTRLIIAAVVLVACGILILSMTLGSPQEQEVPTLQTTQLVQTTGETVDEDSPIKVINIAAAGDLNITDKVVNSGGLTFDFSGMFTDVMPLLTDADLTVLNFEGILCGDPYGSQLGSAPPQVLTALKNAGVDMLQVANSKIINNGMFGLHSTLQTMRSAGFTTIGAYSTEQEFERSGGYIIQEIQGVKVAFVAFTKGMDGMALPAGSEKCVNLLYTDYSSTYKKVNTQGINKILRSIASERPDITIALLHWGSEYNDLPSDAQDSVRNLMFSGGVDVIIGTHPHYVQEMSLDTKKGTFIAYSLGDFLSDAERAGTEYSVVLNLEITKDSMAGTTTVTDFSYTPIFTVEDEEGALRVVRLREAIKAYEAGHVDRVTKETYDRMVYGLKRVTERAEPKAHE